MHPRRTDLTLTTRVMLRRVLLEVIRATRGLANYSGLYLTKKITLGYMTGNGVVHSRLFRRIFVRPTTKSTKKTLKTT